MRKNLYHFAYMFLILLSACNVHEWPNTPKLVTLCLRFNYETDMTELYHQYNGAEVIFKEKGETYDNQLESGRIRYIIHAYPKTGKQGEIQEFLFEKDIKNGYNQEFTLDVLPGDYEFIVWSDIKDNDEKYSLYDANKFGRIKLKNEHKGNTDFRDAFRGTVQISLVADWKEVSPDTFDVNMLRPLGKFEMITDDVIDFIHKYTLDNRMTKNMDIEDYSVRIYYAGFMPNVYSAYTDKPVDSAIGVFFETSLKKLSESKASMGFDYVFVRKEDSYTSIQFEICDKGGRQLTLSKVIDIPIGRNYHTKVVGSFLTARSKEGTLINPTYNGDHNLVFP